jgi:hypothetical protein
MIGLIAVCVALCIIIIIQNLEKKRLLKMVKEIIPGLAISNRGAAQAVCVLKRAIETGCYNINREDIFKKSIDR